MSYAIVRNEKLTRVQAQGICVHNDRKTKKHSNKEIDVERTHLNYYINKNQQSYIKEFDRIKKENNLQGQIRSNSIIMCEMIFTSHTQDKDGNDINKICCRDFWKVRDSYRKLQNAYYEYVTQKGFELERGLPKEETNREHYTIQEFKNITNFEKTKETLKNIINLVIKNMN